MEEVEQNLQKIIMIKMTRGNCHNHNNHLSVRKLMQSKIYQIMMKLEKKLMKRLIVGFKKKMKRGKHYYKKKVINHLKMSKNII